ncbi:MAG: DUF4055 domain-containing protein [Verrucomicrobiota bacterium]
MQVNACHAQYAANLLSWSRTRAVIAGEDAIKAGGKLYLPRLDSQTDQDYENYKTRACFYNATGRSLEGFLGLLFHRQPEVKFPKLSASAQPNDLFPQGVDLAGMSFSVYCKNVAQSVLSLGRMGTLVEWDDESNHAFLCSYQAEDILNWQVAKINGRKQVTMVVLQETIERHNPENIFVPHQIKIYRVLSLEKQNDGSYQYVSEVWEGLAEGDKTTWQPTSRLIPLRQGQPLSFIPFVFHGPRNQSPDVDMSPLAQMIPVNLDHYRLDADYKHGLHFTALPTPWASGFDKDNNYKIGSTTAWVTEQVGAVAGYLEFQGLGLTSFVEALNRDERLLAVLGSRLLEDTKRVGETVEAIMQRQSGENSVLQTIAFSLSESLTTVMRYVAWWELQTALDSNDVLVTLNSDFTIKGLDSNQLYAVVAAWQAGAFSQETMFSLFRKREILPPGRTDAEENELLKKTVMKLNPASLSIPSHPLVQQP